MEFGVNFLRVVSKRNLPIVNVKQIFFSGKHPSADPHDIVYAFYSPLIFKNGEFLATGPVIHLTATLMSVHLNSKR